MINGGTTVLYRYIYIYYVYQANIVTYSRYTMFVSAHATKVRVLATHYCIAHDIIIIIIIIYIIMYVFVYNNIIGVGVGQRHVLCYSRHPGGDQSL